MRSSVFPILYRATLQKCSILQTINHVPLRYLFAVNIGKRYERGQEHVDFSTFATNDDIDLGSEKKMLATNLAALLEESSKIDDGKPKGRMELKRFLENRVKKRVKEQYVNGKFQDLIEKVIADPETLQDAYNCIRLNSKVDITMLDNNTTTFKSTGEELFYGDFDVNANTFSISTRGAKKEILVLPNQKLKIIQEAIRIVLEVVYRPHFSKISHGCRSGRGHFTALKFISKQICAPDWWFTVLINKKVDACILDKLISVMEEKIEDQRLFSIIRSMFDSQVINLEFGGFPKGHGLPQEGVLSPILMNIYLDLFDCEFYRLSMKYEALNVESQSNQESQSQLRNWFRRHLKANDLSSAGQENFSSCVHCCRYMDEIFFAVSGSKNVAHSFKFEALNYLQKSLYLDIDDKAELLPCEGLRGVRFLGTLLKRTVRETPATKAIHKLKEKVELFALQKKEAWNSGTVRIGKKWLAYGLKKVKESEIKHLADPESVLSHISHFRKSGMETDHWYKHLLKIWMQDVKAKAVACEETILSKYVAEPSLPKELRNSFYEFQRRVDEYVLSETASTKALLQSSDSSVQPVIVTQIIAPINAIKKRLVRYGLATNKGYPCPSSLLILQDDIQIIDWFSGIVRRWLRWYSGSDNFSDIKLLISDQVRKACIRTLAVKYHMQESDIENKFDAELSRIPCSHETEQEMVSETLDVFEKDEALMYGISYGGLCLLSLSRMVSESRPCNCFVIGCFVPAESVYALHVMERQKFPGWKTGFSSCIHPSLKSRKIGLCKQHLRDLYLGDISLQSIDFGSWK
ncbi:nuclear intron maturase 4, mitochondrial [Humulus lupulus]|uniref:nuclear intron maturase 4, mitochondrial n=1 Tax=Humulus lupulus TaxID=3486 RepID=UPI002B4103E4|nr:nuclear intron maturase 4, mitochondrial [Humulus lupulus]